MKFLDQAKIYIKAGNGGSGSASFRRRSLLNLVGQTEETVEMADLSFLSQTEILTPLLIIDTHNILKLNMENLEVKKIKLELTEKI